MTSKTLACFGLITAIMTLASTSSAIVVVLLVTSEIGYRAGARRMDAPDSLRSLMSGTRAAMLGTPPQLRGIVQQRCIVHRCATNR